jgi:hypothetical protein
LHTLIWTVILLLKNMDENNQKLKP